MSRTKLLPTYLNSPAWVDLCKAIDFVFGSKIDTPTDNLGKLREAWIFNGTNDTTAVSGQLIAPADMDTFERTILVKQLNLLGFSIRNPDSLSTDQLQRMVRQISVYWYSKGTGSLADFLSYVLDTDIVMTRMWTEDYITFYPEGDPHIGIPIYDTNTVQTPFANFAVNFGPGAVAAPNAEFDVDPEVGAFPLTVNFTDESTSEPIPDRVIGPAPLHVDFTDLSTVRTGGSWYPTTHTTVEVDLSSLPASMTLDSFSQIFADLANYPLVLYYIIATSDVPFTSELGDFVPVDLVNLHVDTEIIANFNLTGPDQTPANNGGRFTPIGFTPIPGPGGQGFVYPPPIQANFTSNVTLGMAPLTVHFQDTSTGQRNSWDWFMGDTGAPSSFLQNPSWTFTEPGLYDIGLQVSGFYSADYIEKDRYISVTPPHPAALVRMLDHTTVQQIIASFNLLPADYNSARGGGGYSPILPIAIQGHGGGGYVPPTYTPHAAFTANVVNGPSPLTVTFTDQSTDLPTSWAWSFQTSTVVNSTLQNPTFTFTQAGTYTVTLIATNSSGSSTVTRVGYINVSDSLANSVILYIPGQGPNNGVNISEFDGYPVGTLGDPTTSTDQAIFNGSSILLDSDDVLVVQNRPDLEIAGSPFMFESFVYLDAYDGFTVVDFDGADQLIAQKFIIDGSGFPSIVDRVNAVTLVGDDVVPLNSWVYVVFGWDGTDAHFIVDTVHSTPQAWTGPTANGTELHFGNVLI